MLVNTRLVCLCRKRSATPTRSATLTRSSLSRVHTPQRLYSSSEGPDSTKKTSISKLFEDFLTSKKEEKTEQRDNLKDLARIFDSNAQKVQQEGTGTPKKPTEKSSFFQEFFEDEQRASAQGKVSQQEPSSTEKPLMQILFPEQSVRMTLRDLKYVPIYPPAVKRWVLDAKTPKGYYDENGKWRTVDWKLGEYYKGIEEKERERISSVPMHFRDDEELPDDLRGGYRFGIRPDEIKNCPPKLKEIFKLKYANKAEILRFRTQQAVARFGEFPGDTGCTQVQVCVLTEKIRSLRFHLKFNTKDEQTNYALNRYISRRHSLMRYLKRRDAATYYKVLKVYNLRDPDFL